MLLSTTCSGDECLKYQMNDYSVADIESSGPAFLHVTLSNDIEIYSNIVMFDSGSLT
jgi:hypothetical protein